MAEEGVDKGKEQAKGFAGLSSLVSDVDASQPGSKKNATGGSGASSGTNRQASAPVAPIPQPRTEQKYRPPSEPKSSSSAGKWVLGIAAVIGLLWLIGQANKPSSSSVASDTPPPQSATPSYPPPPTQSQVSSRPSESTPPVGQNLAFSAAQITYCLAEDMRMDGAKSVVDQYNESDVDRFNAMVADYNSRCSSFKYRRGALESARKDIEPYRSELYSEGRQRFVRYRPQGRTSNPPPGFVAKSQPSAEPRTNLPSRPTGTDMLAGSSPAFSSGPAAQPGQGSQSQSQLTSDERSSIELACIISKSQGAAAYNACIDAQLQQLSSAPRTPSMTSLSYDERSAIELACIMSKSEGAARYNRCLVSQIRALEGSPRQPSMSGLSYDEKSAIELACIMAKSEGAASHNRCLAAQLAELRSGPRTPSLNGLSYQERSAIEIACIAEKSSGAAAYNRCLTMQLSSIGR